MEPKIMKADYKTHRFAPGYRDVDILFQLNGVDTWLSLDKVTTLRLLAALNEVIDTAGKKPIDLEDK